MVKLNPDIFIGCNGQDVVMAKFNKFLLDVPNGEKIQIEPKTMTVLNEIGQALGNMIAGKVAKFNKGVVEATVSA